ANGVSFLDGLRDVGFRQSGSLEQRATRGKVRRKRTVKSAPGAVQDFFLPLLSSERHDFIAVEENVHGFVHVAALDDDGSSTHFDNFPGGGFHVARVLYG